MTRTILDDRIHHAAAKALARAIRNGYIGSEDEWVWRWLERAGIEPSDLKAFARAVVRRARRVLDDAAPGCTGYGHDPDLQPKAGH